MYEIETTHGYEDIFSNYMSMLENSMNYTTQEEQPLTLDEEVDEYLKSISDDSSYEEGSTSYDSIIESFRQSLDSKISLLEEQMMNIEMMSLSNLSSYYDYGITPQSSNNTYTPTMSGNNDLGYDDIKYKQMMTESSGNPKAIGPKTRYGTAKGAFQFIDSTWERYKPHPKASPFNLEDASKARDAYMNDLLKMFNGDIRKALAAYNWGEGNVQKVVQKYGNDWDKRLPKETEGYLRKIVGY